jgi:hypothetical protein
LKQGENSEVPKIGNFLRQKVSCQNGRAKTSCSEKTHAYRVDFPEHDGEIESTLGSQESPEYRFVGVSILIFEGKETQKFAFCLSLTGFVD